MERNWVDVRVSRCAPAAQGILGLELVAPDGAPLPAFAAGAHVDLELPNGMVRPYSLLGDDAQRARYELGILLEAAGRGGSASAHRDIRVDMRLRVSHPRNHFALVPAERTLLFAGGIGVTPILAMAQHLARRGAAFEMHYCSRSPARTAFVERLRGAEFAGCVHFHFDDGDAAQKLDAPALLARPQPATHLYVCGPQGFMDHVIAIARENGWAAENIHFEYFSAAPALAGEARAFELRLALSGRRVPVGATQSAVAALAACGVEVPVSCEQGVCGTCVLKVVDGVPDHRDVYFTDAERARNDKFTPCCSRSKSSVLTVDL